MVVASAAFANGREAALSGESECAQDYFGRALDAVQPPGTPPPANVELRAFAADLYDGIQRYEALANPPEEAVLPDDHIAPELSRIESPVIATEEAMTEAREAVTSDTGGQTYDIPIVVNESVLRILATFQHDLHDIIARGLARSGRYIPMIYRIFEEEGLPRDLAQVAMIESSFIPRAHSPKTAHGIWQFMPKTGRQYGLTANAVIDERSDPEKATRAAAKHLAYLHDLFHDWYLAMAAYNAGEGKILRAIERSGLTDFWQLAGSGFLPAATQNYVPAVLAATLISKNPAHYGFDVQYEKPLAYETVRLTRPVRLRQLAEGDSARLEQLRQLNPELRTEVTPRQPEGYELKVPVGERTEVLAAFAEAPTVRPVEYRRHVARRGETLASVARRFRVPVATLAEINSVSPKARLTRGRVVLVPRREAVRIAAKTSKTHRHKAGATQIASARPASHPQAASYRVRGGDTLYRIALRHGTTVALLMTANSLSSPSSIRAGDRIKIPRKN
jgi:membrane-bound lytic murein transglycosylase D